MSSTKEYARFVADKFARLDVVSIKPMMGEYVVHMAGKALGFIGDDRLMLEPGLTIDRLLPTAEKVELFPGSKLFTIVPDGIAEAIYDDIPLSNPRKRKKEKETPAERFPFVKQMPK